MTVERSPEISPLLALGCRRRHVVRLLLAEAAVATGLGGLLGVALGAGLLLVFPRGGVSLRDHPGRVRLAAAGHDRRDRRRLRAAGGCSRLAGRRRPRVARGAARAVRIDPS